MHDARHHSIARVGAALVFTLALASPAVIASAFAPSRAMAGMLPTAVAIASEESSTTAPLPLRMAYVGDARQLIIATAPDIGATTGTLQVFDLTGGVWVRRLAVPARFGTHGLIDGRLRVAGSRTTPTGIWRMPDYVFGSHAHAPAGTRMRYRRLTWRSWWSSKRGATYNTWVQARRWTGEHIGGSPKAYEFAVSTGYNARPNLSVFGRGTGIFLHVRGAGLTAGCVSISRANMIRVCKLLDRTRRPRFAIGTLRTGTPTSILAY